MIVSTEIITISTEATTITASPSTFVIKSVLETTTQAMFDQFNKVQNKLDKNNTNFYKQHKEMVNIKS